MSLQEIADRLSSDEWQPYWIQQTGSEYHPSNKVVNKCLKRHIRLRGRGAPGSRNGSWKGGVRIDRHGYRLVYSPGHPHAASNGCVREHRLVAEKTLGRFLTPCEVVHHLDDDPSNNSPDNLMVYDTNSQHIRETHGDLSAGQRLGLARARIARHGRLDMSLLWPDDLLRSWHSDGLSCNQIALLLNCDRRSVSRHLTRIGVTSRQKRPGQVTDQHREQCRQFHASRNESAPCARV